MKKWSLILVMILLVSFVVSGSANSTVLTFDDLSPSCTALCGLINNYGNYGGLDWGSRFRHANGRQTHYVGTGYDNGTVSGDYFAYNSGGLDATISAEDFDFIGAYFTAALRDGLNISIKGLNNGAEIYSSLLIVDHDSPIWFQADFLAVDEVLFSSFGGTFLTEFSGTFGPGYQFAMDNFTYNMPAVPEPSTILLLGSGLLGVGIFRKRHNNKKIV